jgi:hypothetical protein
MPKGSEFLPARSALIRASNSDGAFRSAKGEDAAGDLELSGDKDAFSVRKRANARAGGLAGAECNDLNRQERKRELLVV